MSTPQTPTGRMLREHQLVLSKNHEFLVMEMPMDATLEALGHKRILTQHDHSQLKSLRHQGRRALARYLLAVLPVRGERAFPMLLESLQEANAQHLVDLLLAQIGQEEQGLPGDNKGKTRADGAPKPPETPSDTPLPLGPDPHEYAVRVTRNNKLIRQFVDPTSIAPIMAQNKVLTHREADMVMHLHGKDKKWDLILAAVLQRGERSYEAFMAALLQRGYSTMYHTIKNTPTGYSESEEDESDYVAGNLSQSSEEEMRPGVQMVGPKVNTPQKVPHQPSPQTSIGAMTERPAEQQQQDARETPTNNTTKDVDNTNSLYNPDGDQYEDDDEMERLEENESVDIELPESPDKAEANSLGGGMNNTNNLHNEGRTRGQ